MSSPLTSLDWAVILAYMVGMLAVGAFVAQRVGSFNDFYLAGGRMTTPVLVCTLVATYYGLDVTFGSSETAFLEGMAAFFAYSAPFYVAYLATALLVAPRLKRLPVASLPEALGHFYGRPARLAGALASFVYSAPILSVAGMGIIGQAWLGWDPWLASAIGAGLALAYTVMGGLLADALTDTVQFTVMCVSVAIAAVFALARVGDPATLGTILGSEALAPLGTLSMWELAVFAGVALTPLVEPAFYQRTFAAVSSRQVVRALLLGVVLWIAYDWLIVYLGLTGRGMVAQGDLPAGLDESAVVLHVMAALLPPGLLGLFAAGCLASAMSTIDSYTLIAAGNLVYDGWQTVARRPLDDRHLLTATRVLSAVTLIAAFALAQLFDRLRDAWIFMSTVLLSTALVPMLAALAARRRPPALAGQLAAVAGLGSSLLLFVAFHVFGQSIPEEATFVLWFPVPGLGWHDVSREAAVLIALPISAAAFCAGIAIDRALRGRP
jgi:SSS family solute:Na+ symporter